MIKLGIFWSSYIKHESFMSKRSALSWNHKTLNHWFGALNQTKTGGLQVQIVSIAQSKVYPCDNGTVVPSFGGPNMMK